MLRYFFFSPNFILISPIYFQIHTPYSIRSPRILMLGNIWKVHDSSPLQNNFINGIQIHNQSSWFKPMTIHSSKTQFSLATSKPNSYWQRQSPIFIGTTLSKRKELKIINAWQRKNIMLKWYHGKKGPWKSSYEETHWELSWGLCFCIMNPWNTWTSFCITTSIIYTFYTRGKRFKPTSSSSKLLETMNVAIWNSS